MSPSSPDRCPGILHAAPGRDGSLLRIRIPGGSITLAQWTTLARVAEEYGDARIDLTARANVQLRGIRENALAQAARALEETGLLPSARHDRVRNIVASPFAGI